MQPHRSAPSRGHEMGEDAHLPPSRKVFLYFLLLGFVNIGGPVAQITMMFNHMVERDRWLSRDRFVQIMGFAHVLPGPEALQLAIYVGYLRLGIFGGILAGLTFIVPGALVMIVLSKLYVSYGNLPQVVDVLSVLKPAVMGIIAAGVIKLGRAAIKNRTLAVLLVGAFAAMRFAHANVLVVLAAAGGLNLLLTEGAPRLRHRLVVLPALMGGLGGASLAHTRLAQIGWLSLKTGLFSFGGAYASLVFLQRGAVEDHRWLTAGQLLDGVALSVATPGPFMLFTTFVGYLTGGLAGALIATLFVFLPSFILVLAGARYLEAVSHNRAVHTLLAGVSAAVVGVILVVSLKLAPEALTGLGAVVVATLAFLAITIRKIDVAYVALGAMVAGMAYAAVHGMR
jgi:chromate transporter